MQYKEVEHDGQKLFVCYNPERAELDAKHREKILERIKDKIRDGSILSIVDNTSYRRYLDIEGKSPKLSERKIKNDSLYDGVYVLTSNTDMTAGRIIQSYKDLWQVEHAFRALKSELGAGPMYHYTDNRIRAHIMICFLALILRIVFNKKIKAHDEDLSFSQTISDLKKLHVVKMKVKDYEMHIRTDITENAKAAFNAISMKIPNKVLYDEFKEKHKTVALRTK